MTDQGPDRPDRDAEKKALTDDDIVTGRKLGRRSLLGLVGAGLAGATALIGGARPAHAVTDSDSGRCADPGGRGRGPRIRGVTDSDGGPCADPAGWGRRGRSGGGGGGRGGPTDSDSGRFADPAGQGRGGVRTGRTDRDSGRWADPPGGGRWGSGLTDSDRGPYIRDQPGNGRRGY